MPERLILDNDIRENIILDIVALFMGHDIDPEEAQSISTDAIETLHISRGGLLDE